LVNLRHSVFLLAGFCLTFVGPQVHAEESVTICGESWPPYLYKAGDKTGKSKNSIAGIHLRNFKSISEVTGLDFKFEILPWKRCLYDVEKFGRSTDPEIAIDASYNKERAEKYHFIGPLYAFGTAVFYSRQKFPEGPFSKRFDRQITTIADMRDFEICGFLGWNYESYYTKHGFPRSVQIMKSRSGMQSAFSMLSHERCEVLEVHPQIVIGAIATGKLEMPTNITCHKLEGDLQKFYLMVSRNSPRAKELVARMDKAIKDLKSEGKWLSIGAYDARSASGIAEAVKCL
jgi:polar amino acid transport system substrate-binding protein